MTALLIGNCDAFDLQVVSAEMSNLEVVSA